MSISKKTLENVTPLKLVAVKKQRASPLVRVVRETVHEKVYQQLSAALRRGELEMGQVLSLRGLADMLCVSPMPVREAVARLVNEGVLEPMANASRQVRVPVLTMAQYEALIEARVAVEGHAAYLAAIRIDEAGLKEFAGANKRLLQATQREDHEGTMQANQEVHFSIYRAARSPKLLQLIENLWQQSGPYLSSIQMAMAATESMRGHDFGAEQHNLIYSALERRDGEAAKAMLVEDIESFARIYRELLPFFEGQAGMLTAADKP